MSTKEFEKGQRVFTPKGIGTIVYRRYDGDDFGKVGAYSVCLDSEKAKSEKPPFPHYSGTMFAAQDVTAVDDKLKLQVEIDLGHKGISNLSGQDIVQALQYLSRQIVSCQAHEVTRGQTYSIYHQGIKVGKCEIK